MSDVSNVNDEHLGQLPTIRRGPGNPNWTTGVSGNPSGKPKSNIVVRDMARRNTRQAFAVILQIMRNKSYSPSVRLDAAKEVIYIGHGKPSPKDEGNTDVFESFSPEARALINSVCDLLLDKFRSERAQVIDATPTDVPTTDKR